MELPSIGAAAMLAVGDDGGGDDGGGDDGGGDDGGDDGGGATNSSSTTSTAAVVIVMVASMSRPQCGHVHLHVCMPSGEATTPNAAVDIGNGNYKDGERCEYGIGV